MKTGFIGLPFSGKSTIFEAVTGRIIAERGKKEDTLAAVKVPDIRVDGLSELYKPRKITYASVTFLHPAGAGRETGGIDTAALTAVRSCDTLIHIIRNFDFPGLPAPDISRDHARVEEELIFSDLVTVEKRLERLEQDKRKNRWIDPEEEVLLRRCLTLLEEGMPLRKEPALTVSPLLKGYGFLSAKPKLVIYNNADEDTSVPPGGSVPGSGPHLVIRGRIERDIARMPEADKEAFLKEYGISEPAVHRLIRRSYQLLGLISFFTVGADEVKAWTVRENTPAVLAAQTIHSDISKGFIRAETVACNDLLGAGSYANARKNGTVRLEGKTYPVSDGDIMDFRFNV